MPFIYNHTNKVAVTVRELVPTYYQLGTLRLNIWRHKTDGLGIRQLQRACMGKPMLVDFDSLPCNIQDELGDPRKTTHPLQNFYREDAEAVRFFAMWKFEDGNNLPLKYQSEYIVNASVLCATLLLKQARENKRKEMGISLKGIATTLWRDAMSFQQYLKANYNVQHTLPESEKRFKMCLKEFSATANGDGVWKFNYASLISGKLKNENSKKITDDLLELLNNIFSDATEKPTRTEVARRFDGFLSGYVEVINNDTGLVYEPKNYSSLSESTVINYLGKWEDRISTHLKRAGDRQLYINQYLPYASLEMPEFAGEIISVDDRQPPFWYAKGERAWLYMGVDIGSQAWTVWVHGRSKQGIIVDFYRQLVRNYTEWGFRLPAELECESSLNSMFKTTFLRNGAMFDNVRIIANNARTKYIERMYGKLRYEIEKKHIGWMARPFARKEDNQLSPVPLPIIPYEQIIENAMRDIELWNNSEHPRYAGKTRWEVFCERQHPALRETNWNTILPYLGYKTETSCHAGIIKLNNAEFLLGEDGEIKIGSRLIELMKGVEEKQVDVYWLDDNSGKVLKALVMLRGGDTIMCEAVAKPRFSRSIIGRTKEGYKAESKMSAYANTIESYARRHMHELQNLTVIDNRPATLNSKFKIEGLKPRPEEAEYKEPEILPQPDEAELVPVFSNNKSHFDRF